MQIREKVLISELTTMRLGGEAKYVVTLETVDDIKSAYAFAAEKKLPTWIMGGGANTIGQDEGFDGVILLNQIKGIEVLAENGEELLLKGMSGEIWDDLVDFACQKGYSGIEAMSAIPGTVGAAPVQNIGAYGQDLSQTIEYVEAYDIKTKEFCKIKKDEMQMRYRKTRFNTGDDAGRFLITAVVIKLHKTELKPPFYNSLQRYIDENKVKDFSPRNIRKIVSKIREEKLPDPKKIASSGSFFQNVYLDKAEADIAEQAGIPIWRSDDGKGKINGGWLIEQCGLKGKLIRGMRVSDKAALVLINESAKSYADLAAARAEIMGLVAEKFGFALRQEPVEIPPVKIMETK